MAGGQKKDSLAAAAAAAPAAPRAVPGAGPLAAGKGKKKGAAASQASSPATAANGSAQPNKSKMDKAAHAAALTTQAPTSGNVDANLKVQPADMAAEAERQAALAAVDIVQQKENGTNGHAAGADGDNAKGALQAILAKRIKVLNKKLQRAVQYEALDQTKVNEDQRRIVASRPGLEGGVHELTEMAKALEIAEGEAQRASKLQEKQAIAASVLKTKEEAQKITSTLLQLMQLHALVSPAAQASFAPKPMPPILESATGQDMAAVSKLYADLSASNEVTPLDSKMNAIEKLARGSADEILEGVSFQRVLELLEGLDAPATQQVQAADTVATPAPAVTEDAEATGKQISFLQASELEQAQAASNEAPAEPEQAEPEGGAVDSVPSNAIRGGATDKGQAGASGIVLGQEAAEAASAAAPQADGSAKAAVDEPATTTEVASIESAAPTHKVIDWAANDDDDFGDLEIQPNGVNGATAVPQAQKAASSETTAPAADAAAKTAGQSARGPRGEKGASNGQRRTSGAAQQREGGGRAPRSRNSTNQQQSAAKPAAPIKTGPEVDEDGFIVASSKRTKHLQEKQAQQQAAARGGRGAGGRAGRGGGAGSGNNASGRGRNNGQRSSRPPAPAAAAGADPSAA